MDYKIRQVYDKNKECARIILVQKDDNIMTKKQYYFSFYIFIRWQHIVVILLFHSPAAFKNTTSI